MREKNRWTRIPKTSNHSSRFIGNLARACHYLIAIAVLFPIVSGGGVALAATPYQAADVLGQVDFDSSGSGTTAENFSNPLTGLAVDETGHRLFVGDYGNKRVLVFNLNGANKLVDKTADHVLGQTDFTSNNSDVTQSTFAGPSGVAFDSVHKRLFVSDGYSSNNRILVFDLSGGITDGMDASWVLGQPDFVSNNPGTSQSGLRDNGGVSFDKLHNRLFVGDYTNNRVLVFDLSGGITDGMDASWVLGQPDFVTSVGQAGQAGMNSPWGVQFDGSKERLYVADFANNRVLVFDLSGGITDGMDASWVLGQPDFTSGPGSVSTTQNGMFGPISTTTDGSGDLLFVHDGSNARVLIFNASSLTNGQDAIGVIGKPDFDTQGCETSRTGICGDGYDASMYFNDNTRSLYVSDSDNHRALIFNFVNIALGSGSNNPVAVPDATVGAHYNYQIPVTGAQGDTSCELTSGTLPGNVTLTSSCAITGTPVSSGVYNFTVTVTDDNGIAGTFTDSQSLTLTVNDAGGSNTGTGGMLADTGDSPRSAQYIALALITVSTAVLSRYIYPARSRGAADRTGPK